MFRLLALCAALVSMAMAQDGLWHQYKKKFGLSFEGEDDKQKLATFKDNLKTINKHNFEYQNGKHTWYMGINQFSHMTSKEFLDTVIGDCVLPDLNTTKSTNEVEWHVPDPNLTNPSHLDYREDGKVTPVKNQGQCGSCWTFSATGALEGMWKQNRGELISMSEQQMIDCGQGTCNGGWMYWAWETVRNGIESESTYPYTGRDGSCHANSNNFVATNSGDQRVSQSESALESALVEAGHPVSVTVHVGSSFQHYNGGVFSDPQCQYGQLNHAVLAVGYEKSGSNYWMVKNSWGSSWGSSGYINMKIGENSCGIANAAMYPIL